MTPAGIVLPLALSHDVLGQLIAARRSTATIALKALDDVEHVKRLRDGSWLLTPTAERAVHAIATTPQIARSLAELLINRLRRIETTERARALRAEAKLLRARRSRLDAAPANSCRPTPADD